MNLAKEFHYGDDVVTNKDTDNLRRRECLCLNCGGMKGCAHAAQLFEVCKTANIALMVTRCRDFSPAQQDT